jgi:hypothetical protein
MDDRLVEVIERNSRLRNISKSKFVSELVENYNREHWIDVVRECYGSIEGDFPVPEDIPLSLNRKLEPL